MKNCFGIKTFLEFFSSGEYQTGWERGLQRHYYMGAVRKNIAILNIFGNTPNTLSGIGKCGQGPSNK